MNNLTEGETLLRVRISKNIQDAYDLVRDNYDLTQSDLVRMAPLLLTLLAEINFTTRRAELKDGFEQLEQEIKDQSLLAQMKRELEETELRFNGMHFTDYLRYLTDGLDENSKKFINRENISHGRDGLPDYLIFKKTLDKLNEEKDPLLKVAEEVARKVTGEDKNTIPKNPTPMEQIPDRFWVELITKARKELGQFLDPPQMNQIREAFCNAVHRKNESEWELKVAARRISDEMEKSGIDMLGDFIPPEYNGRLLSYARANLGGRYLTATQKDKVRKLLINELGQRKYK